ncbi:HAD family phosphatase [Prolixibacteraceae bacterium JC049]|nr:HAD family phosphatase [Prolixibacteraceae bacterium JC049]
MEIKNIIFDFGGVLIDWNPQYLYGDIFQDNEELDFFLNNVCNSQWNLKQDAGRSFAEAIKELTAKFPQYENEIRMYHSSWITMIGGEIKENTSLIKKLKSNYRLFGLTNWSAETFPLVYNQYPFFKELEGIVVSGEEKVIKPNNQIYELLLDRYKLKACESLFIDDNRDNIATAKRLGFQTIWLCEGVDLNEELRILI